MLLIALLAVAGSIRGTVACNGPLPGVVVSLTSSSFSGQRVTNARGEYELGAVPVGVYDVEYELAGFGTEKRRVTVTEGETTIPRVDMKELENVIVVGCDMGATCTDEPPTSPWQLPSCADFDLDTALMESAKQSDRSAVQLLERRRQTAFTRAESIRIGAFLLGRIRDDSAIWNELRMHAENAVDFAGKREKLEAYCAEHGYDPQGYELVSWLALAEIMSDRRSRPLLLRALASDDILMADGGVIGLAAQHDETALPEIEAALHRFPGLVMSLAYFQSAAADRLAEKYLKTDTERDEYNRLQSDR
jgi:hypothetical protein